MTKHFLFFLMLFLCSRAAYSQYQISGYIKSETGENLQGSTIQLLNASKGAVSNEEGYFKIEGISEGTYFLEVNFIGYQPTRKKLIVDKNIEANFELAEITTQLVELIVTAGKQTENIQETPNAVTAIEAKQIKNLQIDEVVELNRVSANFKTYDDGGGSFPMIASRGIFTIDFEPTVGFYIDDVPFFNIQGFPRLLSDVERIEILKGPQGTLYGRNALAGVINIITKKPQNAFKGFAEVTYGNLGQFNATASANLPLVKEKLYARVSGSYAQRDGYITNTFLNNTDLLGNEVYTGNIRLHYYPTNELSFTLNTNFENRSVNAYALVGGFGVSGSIIDSLKANHPYEVSYDQQGLYETFISNTSFKVSYDAPKFRFNAITSLQYTDLNRSRDDFDFTQFAINTLVDNPRVQTTLSEEIRLSSSSSSKVKWILGTFLYRSISDDDAAIESGELAGHSVGVYTQQTNTRSEQTGITLFGQLEYPIFNKLNLLGGIRYEIEGNTLDIDQFYLQNGTRFEAPDGTSNTPDGPVPSPLIARTFSEEAFFIAASPKVGVSYQVHQDLFLFGNIARGYRPGGLNQFTNNSENIAFDPESSWNYEIGIKTSWLGNRLRANLNAFYIDYSDQQLFTVIDANNFIFGRDNIGRSISQGLELETEWVPLRGLNLIGNIGYLDTEIKEYSVIGFGGEADNSGNEQGYSP
ncbi:MAG: TonB-dependent receptor, partial [Bacteroidota bacterium]